MKLVFYLASFLAPVLLLAACGSSAPAGNVPPPSAIPTVATATQAPTTAPATNTPPQPTATNTSPPPPTATNTLPPPTTAAAPTAAVTGNPVAGQQVFMSQPCSSCHDIMHPYPGGQICPNLGNIAVEAARIVKSPDYHGKAHDAAEYIRESIVNPNAYIVPGAQYRQPSGQSVMPTNFGQVLTPTQIDDLVAFLMLQTNGQLPSKP